MQSAPIPFPPNGLLGSAQPPPVASANDQEERGGERLTRLNVRHDIDTVPPAVAYGRAISLADRTLVPAPLDNVTRHPTRAHLGSLADAPFATEDLGRGITAALAAEGRLGRLVLRARRGADAVLVRAARGAVTVPIVRSTGLGRLAHLFAGHLALVVCEEDRFVAWAGEGYAGREEHVAVGDVAGVAGPRAAAFGEVIVRVGE